MLSCSYWSELRRLVQLGCPACLFFFCLMQLKFVLCTCGHQFLIPPSNIRDIDFLTERFCCLWNYSVEFKQSQSPTCPGVNVDSLGEREREKSSSKNRPTLIVVFVFIQGHGKINTRIAKGVNLFPRFVIVKLSIIGLHGEESQKKALIINLTWANTSTHAHKYAQK